MKNWMGQSERVFTCCHTSQSIGQQIKRNHFVTGPLEIVASCPNSSFMLFKGYVLHPVVCTWNFIAVGLRGKK